MFFIHSSIDGHLGCFQDLAIANSAVINIKRCVYLFEFVFSRCLGKYPVDESVDHLVIFEGTSILSSTVAAPIFVPTNSAQGLLLLHTLAHICRSATFEIFASGFRNIFRTEIKWTGL